MSSVGPRLAELGDADLLALWAMRRWLQARQVGETIESALAVPFNLGGMPDGPTLIDDLMTPLAVSVRRPLAFGCLHCGVVSRDENLLLGVLRLLQSGRAHIALHLLHDTIALGAVTTVCEAARQFANRLTEARLSLARRGVLRSVPVDEVARCANAL